VRMAAGRLWVRWLTSGAEQWKGRRSRRARFYWCEARGHGRRGGQFSLAGLGAGDYEVATSAGPASVSTKLSIHPRDRAVLSIVLRQESTGTVVTLEQPRQFMAPAMVRMGGGGGVIGGIAGGVPGGVRADVTGAVMAGNGAQFMIAAPARPVAMANTSVSPARSRK